MNKKSKKISNLFKLVGSFCGGLIISLPIIPHAAFAQQPKSQANPCPSIFYEQPHDSRVLVPQGCPLNTVSQKLAIEGRTPIRSYPGSTTYETNLGMGGEAPVGTKPELNPCPRIYYEYPNNITMKVPQGCPPNARMRN